MCSTPSLTEKNELRELFQVYLDCHDIQDLYLSVQTFNEDCIFNIKSKAL